MDDASLAYTTSIQKSQGTEIPPRCHPFDDAALHHLVEEPDLHRRHQRKEARNHHRPAEGAKDGAGEEPEVKQKADEIGSAGSGGG